MSWMAPAKSSSLLQYRIVGWGRNEREGSGRAWAIGSKGVKDGWAVVEEKMLEMEQWQRDWMRVKMGEDPLQLPSDFLDGTLEIVISATKLDSGVGEKEREGSGRA
ncbi:hypothetical protein COCNU_16G004950 [Cocos nucifera]|uniref:Uncharacterized protein n=1 Tax=Cocos nucifera TaxID=13894 RepID=A0A8K0IYD2_COCNU|nr:hypothetical protein COCNU_16G004950 [Cocos nucifera]